MRSTKFLPSFIIFTIFSLDRITKTLVQKNLLLGDSIEVFPFFHITYVTNTGIAFGLGTDFNQFFLILSLILVGVLFVFLRYWERSASKNLVSIAALSMVIGGAVGNLYDRIAFGNVIDFLDFFIGSSHWPAFNIADSSVCAGAALLAFYQWKFLE